MLWLLLLQVLASCLWLGHSEVFEDFSSCSGFFYKGTPPNEGLKPANPARICQHNKKTYHFATLYDKTRRIPVYSAYIYRPKNTPKPDLWFVEPQLIGKNEFKEMEMQVTLEKKYNFTLEDIKRTQAIEDDYKSLDGLDRGHLSPRAHQDTFIRTSATNTLTNIVPQNKKLNGGNWNQYELKKMATQAEGCDTTYVITGAVPGNTMVKNRVNIPSHIWSAACCVVGTKPAKAWGVIAENNGNKKFPLLTLGQLETELTKLYNGKQVTLFHSDCPRQQTSHR